MNIFRVIRLGLWGCIVAACIILGATYLAVHQTFLESDGLKSVVKESRVAETVRNEVLLPKVLQTTRGSDYSALLDDKTVTTAFNSAVSTDAINNKLQPAVDSIQKWLNSEEPNITFSISMSELSDDFANTLASEVNKKVADLPACTLRSTLTDAETGVCKSSLITADALSSKIKEMITSDAALASNTTITPDSISISPSIKQKGSDLPSYLNMFYAASLVAAGIIICVGLWLLLKHRLAGIITLGVAAVLGAVGLYIVSIVGMQAVGALSTDSQVQQVARAGTNALESALRQEALYLAVGGVIAALLATIALVIWRKRHHSQPIMHLSSH